MSHLYYFKCSLKNLHKHEYSVFSYLLLCTFFSLAGQILFHILDKKSNVQKDKKSR